MSKRMRECLELPPIRIHYCTTPEQQEMGCQVIQNRIAHDRSWCVWGFDCEWKVSYVAGQASSRVAVIQFGTKDLILLFQISQSGLQSSLVDIIKSSDHIKVGVNIIGDIQKLERDFPACFPVGSIAGACDLRRLSEVAAIPPQRSLAGMVETELHCTLPKPTSTRCGDWEAVPLSADQVRYAALDVYAAVLLYDRLVTQWQLRPSSEGKSLYEVLRKNFISTDGGGRAVPSTVQQHRGGNSGPVLTGPKRGSDSYGAQRERCGLVLEGIQEGECRASPSESIIHIEEENWCRHSRGIAQCNTNERNELCNCVHCCFRAADSKPKASYPLEYQHQPHVTSWLPASTRQGGSLITLPCDILGCRRRQHETHRWRVIESILDLPTRRNIQQMADIVDRTPSLLAQKPKPSCVTSKEQCFRLWREQNLSVEEIASKRNIKVSTVRSYLIDLISKGYEFSLSKFLITTLDVLETVTTCCVYHQRQQERMYTNSTPGGKVSESDEDLGSSYSSSEPVSIGADLTSIYCPPYKHFADIYRELFLNSFLSQFCFTSDNTESTIADQLIPPYWVFRVVAIFMSRSVSPRDCDLNWVEQVLRSSTPLTTSLSDVSKNIDIRQRSESRKGESNTEQQQNESTSPTIMDYICE